MEKFNTCVVSCNGFVSSIWATSISIPLTDQKKTEIKKLVNEKQASVKNQFSIDFKVVDNDLYKGCCNIEFFITGILSSIK